MNDEARFERILGRPLADNELGEFQDVDALPKQAIAVARVLAKESKPLAVMYLRALVPSRGVGALMVFLEQILQHEPVRGREADDPRR